MPKARIVTKRFKALTKLGALLRVGDFLSCSNGVSRFFSTTTIRASKFSICLEVGSLERIFQVRLATLSLTADIKRDNTVTPGSKIFCSTNLQELAHWGVSVIATTGLQFDLTTPQGKLIASVMACLAEFERDLVRERVCSGLAAVKAKGKKLGRKPGQRVKSDRYADKVLQMVAEGHSYRQIAHELHLSKTTVNEIVKRHRRTTVNSSI